MTSLDTPWAASKTSYARTTSRYGDVYRRARASSSSRSARVSSIRYGLTLGIGDSTSAAQRARDGQETRSKICRHIYEIRYLAAYCGTFSACACAEYFRRICVEQRVPAAVSSRGERMRACGHRDVSSRLREAGHEPVANGVSHAHPDYRDRGRRLLCGTGPGRCSRNDQIDLETRQFSRQSREPL